MFLDRGNGDRHQIGGGGDGGANGDLAGKPGSGRRELFVCLPQLRQRAARMTHLAIRNDVSGDEGGGGGILIATAVLLIFVLSG